MLNQNYENIFGKKADLYPAMIDFSFDLMSLSIKSLGKHVGIYHKQFYSGDTRHANRGLYSES